MADDQLALVLNQELANQMNQPQFTELMQQISQYEVQSANVRVTSDVEYQLATDSLVAVAEVDKSLENLRKEIVAYPNTFTTAVNATFRTLKTRTKKTRDRIEYHARAYKQKKDAEFARQQAEMAAAAVAAQVVDADAEAPPPEPPQPPLQSTKGTEKGSVSYRKGPPKIEVVNKASLVRAATDGRNKIPVDVIAIDAVKLKEAVKDGIYTNKQWEKYGVKVTETEEMVVRT